MYIISHLPQDKQCLHEGTLFSIHKNITCYHCLVLLMDLLQVGLCTVEYILTTFITVLVRGKHGKVTYHQWYGVSFTKMN